MSKIASTNGISILSRYMTTMAVAITSTTASLPNRGSENEQSSEIIGTDRYHRIEAAGVNRRLN